ncbi:GspH/FimT family pseudopilin [Undibacterium jejuense]|uniref:Type II secretion system protein H n=1 Tax=Undibacterium jejuense TaxID=1344949 RepID=A0A923HJE5_9BURK|nr:GspH/FimT family pseudopilin [Undibacterium jejuense]MBC3863523.1 GspH/FimT family pseudopilin [Undibacterium jejuense]
MTSKQQGMTLIELLIVLVITGILLMGVISTGKNYMTNAKVRSTSEELREGLLYARAQAITRNTVINFSATANGSWQVITPAKVVIQSRSTNVATVNVNGADANGTPRMSTSFSGSGRPGTPVIFDITPQSVSCSGTNGGSANCLRVQVDNGGQVKICNPGAASAPYACA